MKKSELNPNICISKGNDKLKSSEKHIFYMFNLPSVKTCPYSTEICRKSCYSRSAENMFKLVRESRQRNFNESQKETFVQDMINHLSYRLNLKSNKDRTILFRIHESGDFYSKEYLDKWIDISNFFKDKNIIFQVYTKSIIYFEGIDVNKLNIKVMYSVMPDTDEKSLELAKQLNMSIFKMLSKHSEIADDMFLCKGDCNRCKVCYTGEQNFVFVRQHGAGIKDNNKSHLLDRFSEYKKNHKK